MINILDSLCVDLQMTYIKYPTGYIGSNLLDAV